MRCEHLHDSAVYVLGALSPSEREAYERHLAGCAECRAEVAQFADLPGLLGRLEPQPAHASDTSEPADRINGAAVDPLLPRVLDRASGARRTERRRRLLRTAGTAIAAAFLGVVAVLGVRAAGVGQPDYVAMHEVAATVPITAALALSPASDGTLVRMRCGYKSDEGFEYLKWTYKLVVVPKSGEPEEIDTWTARAGDQLELTAHSGIAEPDIQRVEIRKGDGTPLLSLAA